MASSSLQGRNQSLEIDGLLRSFPGLRLLPVASDRLQIAGTLSFTARSKGFQEIQDSFDVEISVPQRFPIELPVIRETGGKVPKSFHTNKDGTLCLGSPTRQRLCLSKSPTVLAFANTCIIPYFYNFAYFKRHGTLPLGELAHGLRGIRQDYAQLFGVRSEGAAVEMVRLTSIKRRIANKHSCPCGSGRRLGKCHNRKVNGYRDALDRSWFRKEYQALSDH